MLILVYFFAEGMITVPVGKRGKLIGLGGMVIRGLEQEYGMGTVIPLSSSSSSSSHHHHHTIIPSSSSSLYRPHQPSLIEFMMVFYSTGITITQLNEEEYALFAPNRNTYDEVLKRIDELLVEKNIFEVSKE